jgi:hypothetical protein
VDDTFLVEE